MGKSGATVAPIDAYCERAMALQLQGAGRRRLLWELLGAWVTCYPLSSLGPPSRTKR
jgi:hypothetical protein